MPGILYIVATPIGNLDDMPPRVAATFGAADFVAAEDTRVTLKLLNHLGLKKPMMSYYEHALHHGAAILDRIEAGESCALGRAVAPVVDGGQRSGAVNILEGQAVLFQHPAVNGGHYRPVGVAVNLDVVRCFWHGELLSVLS